MWSSDKKDPAGRATGRQDAQPEMGVGALWWDGEGRKGAGLVWWGGKRKP